MTIVIKRGTVVAADFASRARVSIDRDTIAARRLPVARSGDA
jgi:hypothetical protein